VVDLDRVQRNIVRLQAACDAAGVANRPHIKTHKSPVIARMQVEAGARGIACQKLGEAEVMAAAGLDDILITYNLIGEQKTGRRPTPARHQGDGRGRQSGRPTAASRASREPTPWFRHGTMLAVVLRLIESRMVGCAQDLHPDVSRGLAGQASICRSPSIEIAWPEIVRPRGEAVT
jgi:hypothetical protein